MIVIEIPVELTSEKFHHAVGEDNYGGMDVLENAERYISINLRY